MQTVRNDANRSRAEAYLKEVARYSQIWCMGKFGLGGDILLLIFTIIRFIQNRYPILKLYSSSHFR